MNPISTIEGLDTDAVCSELGERVRSLRQSQNITQEELAYRSGLHRTYVGCIERGEKNVSVAAIFKVARGLGVEPWELFNGNKQETR